MGIRRTTVGLEEGLYRQVRRLAVEREMTIREIVQEAVRLFCEGRWPSGQEVMRPQFGIGRFQVKGGMRRADLYEDRR